MTKPVKLSRHCMMAIILTALSFGCSRSDAVDGPRGLTVRDSAGIQIIEVPGALLDALPARQLSPTPVLSVGEVDGALPYLLTDVKPTGFVPLPDGGLAIVDGVNSSRGSREIRVFDQAGRFVRAIGRIGEGPGEFTAPPDLQLSDRGSLVAFERTNRRVTLFDEAGAVLDTWTVDLQLCPEQPCTLVGGVLRNAGVPVVHIERPSVDLTMVGQIIEGRQVTYGLSNQVGYSLVAAVPAPSIRVFRVTLSGGREAAVTAAPLLSSIPVLTTGLEHVAIAFPDRGDILVFNQDGMLLRIIRLQRDPVPVTSADRAALLAAQQPVLDGQTVNEFWPHFGSVRFGDQDHLWVTDFQRSQPGGAAGAEHISVFDVTGRPLARIEVRADPLYLDQSRAPFHELVSSPELYRVITQDGMGVQRIHVFPLATSDQL